MARQPPYQRSYSSPAGRAGNGSPAGGAGGQQDLYRQLIDSNDLVKELDDIEAISQQISQHAEVLYQSWKNNNGLTQNPSKFKLAQQQQQQAAATAAVQSGRVSPSPGQRPPGSGSGAGGGFRQMSPPLTQDPPSFNRQASVPATTNSSFPKRGATVNDSTYQYPLYRQNGGTSGASSFEKERASPLHFSTSSSEQQQQHPRMPSSNPPRLNSNASETYSRLSPTPSSYMNSNHVSDGQPEFSTVPRLAKHRPVSNTNSTSPTPPSAASGLSAPGFLTGSNASKSNTLPSRGTNSSQGNGNNNSGSDVTKSLELLAAPEVNGNLKELVNSFVSTDRAKQAARQTIANTISNMTKRNGGPGGALGRSASPSTTASPASSRSSAS